MFEMEKTTKFNSPKIHHRAERHFEGGPPLPDPRIRVDQGPRPAGLRRKHQGVRRGSA